MIEIIDNYLDDENFKKIQSMILSDFFPWYFKPGIDYSGDNKFQFTHNVYEDHKPQSSIYDLLEPLLTKLNPKALIRIKCNLLTRTNEIEQNTFHIDYKDCNTAIFYINTNNGLTVFKNGKTVSSVQNRLINFDSNLMHTGTTCTDDLRRIVININYINN